MWVQSYLTGRSHTAALIRLLLFQLYTLLCWCSPGLCSGPTLIYHLHFSNLPHPSSHNIGLQHQHADDTQLFVALTSNNVHAQLSTLESCAGPALANRRPHSNFPLPLPAPLLPLPSLPVPFSSQAPLPPFFFLLFPSLPPLSAANRPSYNQIRGLGNAVSFPAAGSWGGALAAVAFCYIVCSQTHLLVAALISVFAP